MKKKDEVILEEEIFAVSSKNLKRKAKDSVFTSLFKDSENVARFVYGCQSLYTCDFHLFL